MSDLLTHLSILGYILTLLRKAELPSSSFDAKNPKSFVDPENILTKDVSGDDTSTHGDKGDKTGEVVALDAFRKNRPDFYIHSPRGWIPMADHTFHEMFPLGEDTTEYRKLTSDFVSTTDFQGEEVLLVNKEALTMLSAQAFEDIAHFLGQATFSNLLIS